MSRPIRWFAAALVMCSAGCGQKGALYLPDASPQAVKTAPATPAAPTPAATVPAATPPVEDPARRKTPTDPEPPTTR